MRRLGTWAAWAFVGLGLVAALLLAGMAQAHAQVQGQGLRITSTFEGGFDAWRITPSRPDPSSPKESNGSVLGDHDSLGLPDADTKWNYRSLSPWLRYTGSMALGTQLEVNLKFRADQWMGAHADVADVDWALSPYFGFRAGVVNFNTTWCRTYDADTPWIMEPDIFCHGNGYMAINNAAPGIQIYTNTAWDDVQLQTIAGVYRPQLFSYETKEFGFNTQSLGNSFKVHFNRKFSAAANFLHLSTGTQLKLGWMRSDEGGFYDPKPTGENRPRRNKVDNYYLGLDAYVHKALRLRYSQSEFISQDDYADVLVVQDRDKSQTLELIYDWRSTDVLALGWARFHMAASVNDAAFSPPVKFDDYYSLSQRATFISWRHQWGSGLYTTLQWIQASQTNGYFGARRSGMGDAVGLRVGYQY